MFFHFLLHKGWSPVGASVRTGPVPHISPRGRTHKGVLHGRMGLSSVSCTSEWPRKAYVCTRSREDLVVNVGSQEFRAGCGMARRPSRHIVVSLGSVVAVKGERGRDGEGEKGTVLRTGRGHELNNCRAVPCKLPPSTAIWWQRLSQSWHAATRTIQSPHVITQPTTHGRTAVLQRNTAWQPLPYELQVGFIVQCTWAFLVVRALRHPDVLERCKTRKNRPPAERQQPTQEQGDNVSASLPGGLVMHSTQPGSA